MPIQRRVTKQAVSKAPADRAPDRLSQPLDQVLRDAARRRQLNKGETLYTRGSRPDSIFCVERGAVQLSTTSASGREAVLAVVEGGRWFGELTVFIQAPRVHDAKALTDAELLVVSARRLQDIVNKRPEHVLEFLRLVCFRYKWAIERMDATILQPLSVRLAHLLAVTHERAAGGHAVPLPELKVSQESLGHMLGASRQSVNRQLKQWELDGLLRVSYGCITLLDLNALQRLALLPPDGSR